MTCSAELDPDTSVDLDRDARRRGESPRVLVVHGGSDRYGSDKQLLQSVEALRAAGCPVTVCVPTGGPLLAALTGVATEVVPFRVLRKALLGPLGALQFAARLPGEVIRLARAIRRLESRRRVRQHDHDPGVGLRRAAGARTGRRPCARSRGRRCSGGADRARGPARARLLRDRQQRVLPPGAHRCRAPPRRPRARRAQRRARPGAGRRRGADTRPGRLWSAGSRRARGSMSPWTPSRCCVAADRTSRSTSAARHSPGTSGTSSSCASGRARQISPDAVVFHGYVENPHEVLARSGAVLVPSRVEPFGNAAVEAMLARRPVIVSDVQGLAEIVIDDAHRTARPTRRSRCTRGRTCSGARRPCAGRRARRAGPRGGPRPFLAAALRRAGLDAGAVGRRRRGAVARPMTSANRDLARVLPVCSAAALAVVLTACSSGANSDPTSTRRRHHSARGRTVERRDEREPRRGNTGAPCPHRAAATSTAACHRVSRTPRHRSR